MENVETKEVFLDENDKIGANSENKMAEKLGTCYGCGEIVHQICYHKKNRRVPSWIIVGGVIFHKHCYKKWKGRARRLLKKTGYGAKKLR